jgi:hypothetical protein
MTRFYTPDLRAWLNGYEPVIAAEMAGDRKAKGDAIGAAKQTARRMVIPTAIDIGRGTIPGLSAKSDPAKAGRIRKASHL